MDNDAVLHFIEAYKAKKILWDPSHRNYYNRNLKKDAWDELSKELMRPVELLKKKMEYLLSAFRREKQKVSKSMTTGQGADDVYKSPWFAFSHMMFLIDKNKPRERISTEDSNMEEKEDSEGEGESSQTLAADSYEPSGSRVPDNDPTETEPANPKPAKKKQKKTIQKDPIVMEALQLMRSSAQAANNAALAPPLDPDSSQIYANYLASKFRTYSKKTLITVEHKINNILYCADSGEYERERRSGYSRTRSSTPVSPLATSYISLLSEPQQSMSAIHEPHSSRTQTPFDPTPNECVSYPDNSLLNENIDDNDSNSVENDCLTEDLREFIKFKNK